MGVGGHFWIMRHKDDGYSGLVELLEHVQDFNTGVRIEVARRLIGENERRAINQGPGDRDPLLLTARHLRRVVIGSTGHSHALQQGVSQPRGLGSGTAVRRVVQRHLDILHSRGPRAG